MNSLSSQKYSPVYGVAAPELGWVPLPRYLMRRSRVIHHLRNRPRGKLLEIGCGAGALLFDLFKLGYDCTALDFSDAAQKIAETINQTNGLVVHGQPAASWSEAFDYVAAFEVLEHIEDDIGALLQWRGWLKSGGTILLSVPAHESRWTSHDDWAGHYRRYERDGLNELFETSGFQIERIESYGFPLANLVAPLRTQARRSEVQTSSPTSETSREEFEQRTKRSGIDRSKEAKHFRLISSFPGRMALRAFSTLQRCFLNFDWGDGYLVIARRIR